jgi:hypothetical protein
MLPNKLLLVKWFKDLLQWSKSCLKMQLMHERRIKLIIKDAGKALRN